MTSRDEILPFQLPATREGEPQPEWTGRGFKVGDALLSVLEYSENNQGWSDELTDLHEDAPYGTHPIDLASIEEALRQLHRYVKAPSPALLEVGCSSGGMLQAMKQAFPVATVIGADIVKEPLYRLAARLPDVPLLRFDLLRCPLPGNSLNAVVMLNVLEHIEHDVAALRQVHRVLKPGGVLVLEVPAGPRLYDAYDRALCHFRRYAGRELRRKMEAAGFRVVRESASGVLVYPGFALVKLWGRMRRKGHGTELVSAQAKGSAASWLVRVAFRLEARLGRHVLFPFGIRRLAVGIKE